MYLGCILLISIGISKAIVSALKEKQQTNLVNAEPSSGIFIGIAWKVVLRHAIVRKVEFGRFLGIVWFGLVWPLLVWFGMAEFDGSTTNPTSSQKK